MSNILAAIGRGQLQVLDERVKRKREIFDYYKGALEDENIESRPVWKPMHLQPVFGGKSSSKQKSKRSKQCYPARVVGGTIAEDLFNRGLCLPSGTAMTEIDLGRVVDTILKCTPYANDRV